MPSSQDAHQRYARAAHLEQCAEINLEQARRYFRECEAAARETARYKGAAWGVLTWCRRQDVLAIAGEAAKAGFEVRDAEDGKMAHEHTFVLAMPDGKEMYYVSGMWVLDDDNDDIDGADVRLPRNRDDLGLTPDQIHFLTWSEDFVRALHGYWQRIGPYENIATIDEFIAYLKSRQE